MQKLEMRNTYTPTNTSLVRSNCDLELNRDQSLSVQGLKTSSNNLEETQSQHKGKQDLGVPVVAYVLNMRGEPLMPTSPCKANRLLKANRAKVVKRCPFTIQLLFASGESKQEIICGIDAGSDNIGFSCITEKKVLIKGEAKLDSHMKDRLDERRMYRKNRRNKLWYRKPRFLNRNIPKGWLPPSIQRRFNVHISLINRLKKILPITKVIVETASFDTQKLDNPEIQGTEYQQGNLYGYKNMKNYIFARENGKCQLCGEKDGKFHLHHIIPRSKGGTDRSTNLALLHGKCHNKLHKKNLEKTLKANKQFKEATFMSIIHKRFQDFGCETTYGYITAVNRNALGLEKTHANDAFVIAGGTTQPFVKQYKITQKRKNNRSLQLNRKGFKPSIRKNHYMNQPHDLVTFEGKIWEVVGTRGKGKGIVIKNKLGEKKDVNIKKIVSLFHANGLIWNI
jgi:hypothetical protein